MPLFGTRRVERLEENLGALSVALSPDELGEIDRLSADFKVQGERYPQEDAAFGSLSRDAPLRGGSWRPPLT